MTRSIFLCALLVMMHAGKGVPEKSGVFVDGKISTELQTALVGGSVANPKKGSSFRLSLEEKSDNGNMISAKRGGDNTDIYITGFRDKGREYSKAGEYIDRIVLKKPRELVIELDQGRYLNSNPDVRSVTFRKFDIEDQSADILIDIILTSGQKITIAFTGPTSYDGLY